MGNEKNESIRISSSDLMKFRDDELMLRRFAEESGVPLEEAREARDNAFSKLDALAKGEKMKWVDETTYSQFVPEEKRTGRVWALVGEHLQISIHRSHGLDGWFVSCPPLKMRDHELVSEDLEEAKREGILFVRKRADELAKSANIIFQKMVKGEIQ